MTPHTGDPTTHQHTGPRTRYPPGIRHQLDRLLGRGEDPDPTKPRPPHQHATRWAEELRQLQARLRDISEQLLAYHQADPEDYPARRDYEAIRDLQLAVHTAAGHFERRAGTQT